MLATHTYVHMYIYVHTSAPLKLQWAKNPFPSYLLSAALRTMKLKSRT